MTILKRVEVPNIVTTSYERLKVSRERLYNLLVQDVGCVLHSDSFNNLVLRVTDSLPESVDASAVRRSLMHFAGVELTQAEAFATAWRIAANIHKLRNNEHVLPWKRQTITEWSMIVVEDALPVRRIYGKGDKRKFVNGVDVSVRFLTGEPAGLCAKKFWSREYIFRNREFFGYARRKSNRNKTQYSALLSDELEVFGLSCFALVCPELSKEEPGFKELSKTDSSVARNMALLRCRQRSGFKCPFGKTISCFNCPVGRDQCPASCHLNSFQPFDCPVCLRVTWADPVAGCISCKKRGVQ